MTRMKKNNYKNYEDSLSQPTQSKCSKHKLKLTSKYTSKSYSSTDNTVDAFYNKADKSN